MSRTREPLPLRMRVAHVRRVRVVRDVRMVRVARMWRVGLRVRQR